MGTCSPSGWRAARARVEAEPETEQGRLVGCLPLAVRIAGARLAARPDRPLACLTSRLSERRRIPDEPVAGDLAVRSSLELSYAGLADRERTALRAPVNLVVAAVPAPASLPTPCGVTS